VIFVSLRRAAAGAREYFKRDSLVLLETFLIA
jgi:hypothetical protein